MMQSFALPIIQSPLGLPHVLTLGAALFALGLFAMLAHRNLLRILMGLSLMLFAVMLNLVAFTAYLHPEGLHGHAITLLLVLLTLAQLAIGLTLIAKLLRPTRLKPAPEAEPDALNVDCYDDLKG